MTAMRRMTGLAMAVLLAIGLGACREEERNRPLAYEKGVYNGPRGVELTEEQLRNLRQRARQQAGAGL